MKGNCVRRHRIVATALRVHEILGLRRIEEPNPRTGKHVTQWTLRMITEVSTFGKEAFTTLNSATKVIQIGGAAIFGVGLIVDVGTIVYYSIKVHKKQPSQVAELFRAIAEVFDEEQ